MRGCPVGCSTLAGIASQGLVTIGATTLRVIEAREVEPGIRELRCASAIRPWRQGDKLLSVYSHVRADAGATAFRSLEEARVTSNVVRLPVR